MRRSLITILLLAGLPRASEAQGGWTATFERGTTIFSAAAHDTSTPTIRVVPWRPTLYTIRFAREGARVGAALGLTVGRGEMGGSVEEVVVLAGLRYTLLEAAPEVVLRVATTRRGATLRLQAGPVVDLWLPSGDDPRTTYGAALGATLLLPLTDHWNISVRGDGAITTSELTPDEASDAIIREHRMRRGRLGLGVTRRL